MIIVFTLKCSGVKCLGIFNDKDELVAANCISFNLDGSQIYCGFNKMVRVFDTARPGRDFQQRPTTGVRFEIRNISDDTCYPIIQHCNS